MILDRKLQEFYVAGLEGVVEDIPELQPKMAMSDNEKGMQNAVKIVWPDIILTSCYFHFCKVYNFYKYTICYIILGVSTIIF